MLHILHTHTSTHAYAHAYHTVLKFLSWLPELVSALNGLLDVVMALDPVAVACVAVAAAANAARFCIALRPEMETHNNQFWFISTNATGD